MNLEKLAVVHKGKAKYLLNENLLEKQKVTEDNIEKIRLLHIQKLELFDKMNEESDSIKLRDFAKEFEGIEFKLQALWNFPINKNYHEWYTVPKCSCPKMDNKEYRGTEFRIYNQECLIHGK